ncbi:MAG TPA: urease accessory protein UreE [Steroidobacteraceae bacterium]|nr:urease accessory protein UreE [Steroidobacteraceae bacterium]
MSHICLVTELLRAGSWLAGEASDRIVLSYDERHRRRFRYVSSGGIAFLLDLPRATVLRAGDALRLDDGTVVRIEAAAEPLARITTADTATLMRLAWHIGNRHLAAQLESDAILIREDAVIAQMLIGLGATVEMLLAPFTPEPGAYGHAIAGHARSAHAAHPHHPEHAHE